MRLWFLLFLAALLPGPPEGISADCPPGQEKIGAECKDYDECKDAESRSQWCVNNSVCYNTAGSYYCQCVTGYRSKKVNFTAIDGECGDINECKENNNICGSNTKCNNTIGSYYCACSPGFISSNGQKVFNSTDEVTCRDINECENETLCGSIAECNNTNGSYYCTCKKGFVASNNQERFNKSDDVTCKDINECEEEEDLCPTYAGCYNTPGSYYCKCKYGFKASNNRETFVEEDEVECEEIKFAGGNTRLSHAVSCTDNCGEGTEQEKGNSGNNNNCKCKCKDGYINFGIKNNTCSRIPNNNLLNRSSSAKFEIPKQFGPFLNGLNDTFVNLSNGIIPKEVDTTNLLQRLLEAIDDLLSAGRLNNNKKVSIVLETVEGSLRLIGMLLINDVSKSSKHTRVQILVSRESTTITRGQGQGKKKGHVKMSTQDVTLVSNWSNAAGNDPLGFASMALISYQGLEKSTDKYFDWIKTNKSEKLKVNSNVISVAVTNPNTSHLQEPVTLTVSHLEKIQSDKYRVICVFWDWNLTGGAWSADGCSVVSFSLNQTTCSCSHLSSFAVLLALYDQEPVFELQLITWIGLSLSLICLFISILTFQFIRSIKSTRTTIHLHLCISLFIADLVFLAGISQTQNKVGCGVVAGLLHFFFLAVFCWMCLEGVQLFRMVVLVFNTTVNPYYLMAAGYGVPALIVAVSAGINSAGYGTENHCWLNIHDGFIWSFFGPVCFIIIINAFFFFITVYKLAQKFSSLNTEMGKLRKIRTFTITAIAQLCVLGTMWIFGCFQFDDDMIVMSYLFTIFNSLQGVLVFIMHCLLSRQVREEYANILSRKWTQRKRSYSEFSSNPNSKSQGSKSVQNTAEMKM